MSIDDLIQATVTDPMSCGHNPPWMAHGASGWSSRCCLQCAGHPLAMAIDGNAVIGYLNPFVVPSVQMARACGECYAVQGHWGWCVGKGYTQVGPHPESPEATPETERLPSYPSTEMCCGGTCVRATCEYHQ